MIKKVLGFLMIASMCILPGVWVELGGFDSFKNGVGIARTFLG